MRLRLINYLASYSTRECCIYNNKINFKVKESFSTISFSRIYICLPYSIIPFLTNKLVSFEITFISLMTSRSIGGSNRQLTPTSCAPALAILMAHSPTVTPSSSPRHNSYVIFLISFLCRYQYFLTPQTPSLPNLIKLVIQLSV